MHSLPIVNISHQNGSLVNKDEPTLMYHNHQKSIVLIRAHSGCCILYGFGQILIMVKDSCANAGDIRDMGLIPGSGKFLGGGQGNPLQYSCLENPMDGGAWQAAVYRVAKSWT